MVDFASVENPVITTKEYSCISVQVVKLGVTLPGTLASCKRSSHTFLNSFPPSIKMLRPEKLMISCDVDLAIDFWATLCTVLTRNTTARVLRIFDFPSALRNIHRGIGLATCNMAGDGIVISTFTAPDPTRLKFDSSFELLLLLRVGSIIGGGSKGSSGRNRSSRFTVIFGLKLLDRTTLTHMTYLISALPLFSFDWKLKDGGKVVRRCFVVDCVFWQSARTGNLSWNGRMVIPFGKVKPLDDIAALQ